MAPVSDGLGNEAGGDSQDMGGFSEAWLRCPMASGRMAPAGFHQRGPDAPSAHRRPGYPLSGCVPAEPDSVSPGGPRLATTGSRDKRPSDTGAMPARIDS